jgi:hypothetical protein
MGENGREHILRNFLITRNLKDYLKLFSELSAKQDQKSEAGSTESTTARKS